MTLGDLDVACPGCGEMLHVAIEGVLAPEPVYEFGQPVATVIVKPVIPDHQCPPPRGREPIARAA